MEDLTRLVAESMARHGIEVALDHRRLQWSNWAPCKSSFDLLLVPSKPGLFALAEELIPPGDMPFATGKRMLAVFQVSEAADLGIALVRLFAPGTALTARLAEGRIFARYTVIEDDAQRRSAHTALQLWLAASAETATGVFGEVPQPVLNEEFQAKSNGRQGPMVDRSASLPNGF